MSDKKKKAGGGSFRSILVILISLFAIGMSGFAAYMVWEMKKGQGAQQTTESGISSEELARTNPLYLSLNTFTVSLKPSANENDRVLFIGLSLRLADSQAQQTLEKYLPEYRSRLLILLAKSSYDELTTDTGKERLVASIREEVSKPLASGQTVNVTDVLFNEFILR